MIESYTNLIFILSANFRNRKVENKWQHNFNWKYKYFMVYFIITKINNNKKYLVYKRRGAKNE